MLEKITIIAFDLDDTLWPCIPTINHAELTLYQWLEQNHSRITTAYNEEELVALRREFSAQDPRYSVDLTSLRYDFLEFLVHGFRPFPLLCSSANRSFVIPAGSRVSTCVAT